MTCLMLAEISDKMPSILGLWMTMLVFGSPFFIGLMHRWVAWILLPFGLALSTCFGYAFYRQAFVEPMFSDAVQRELGLFWSINSIASCFTPAAIALAMVVYWRTGRSKGQPSQRMQR